MTTASLKITLGDGTAECFSESVGEKVDYTEMDKALHRLQEKSNSFLTVHVKKEKELLSTATQKTGQDDDTQDDDEESSEDDDEENANKQDKPPEKKPKLK